MGTFEQVPETIKADKGFLRRVTAATAFGEGLDGYDLGAISVVLPLISHEFNLSAAVEGLLGASTLIGIFLGGPIVGYLTDRFGRRKLFTLDVVSFIVLGAAQIVVPNAWVLILVRLLLGMSIGAEYAIGPTMLAELSPSKGRGTRLSYLQVCWYIGFLAAVALAYALTSAGLSWRWILGTSAVPALLTLILRYGLPESPRWPMSRDRVEEARRVVNQYLGGEQFFRTEDLEGESTKPGQFRELFAKGVRSRTAFVCIFWASLVAPYFAIFTFAPLVFDSLHITDQRAGTLAANGVAALGAIAGMLIIERTGRRRLLITCFWIMVVALGVIGAWGAAPAIIVVVCFAGFSFFNAISGDLTGVYPAEVFPSHLRSSGIGFAAAMSRVGAAAGTFLLPIGVAHFGVGPSVLIGGGICVVGALVTHAWAPETTGQSLTSTGKTEKAEQPAGAAG
ncbi:MAG: MFS transporter [Mycobacteriales bacterium]